MVAEELLGTRAWFKFAIYLIGLIVIVLCVQWGKDLIRVSRAWKKQLHKTKLRGFSPQANYTDRATAACRRS
jgi:hypothetical protein